MWGGYIWNSFLILYYLGFFKGHINFSLDGNKWSLYFYIFPDGAPTKISFCGTKSWYLVFSLCILQETDVYHSKMCAYGVKFKPDCHTPSGNTFYGYQSLHNNSWNLTLLGSFLRSNLITLANVGCVFPSTKDGKSFSSYRPLSNPAWLLWR